VVHAGGFNLGLVMRKLVGVGKPKRLQGRIAAISASLHMLCFKCRTTIYKLFDFVAPVGNYVSWCNPLTSTRFLPHFYGPPEGNQSTATRS
jgi:hypothetical protein